MWRQLLHTDWVCQLQYISELNSILSCSLDKRLCLADVEARVTVKYLEGHTQGVRAVDWSKAYSFIASGGLDRNVMLWNPFQLQSMATLQVGRRNAQNSCDPLVIACIALLHLYAYCIYCSLLHCCLQAIQCQADALPHEHSCVAVSCCIARSQLRLSVFIQLLV